MAAKMEKKMTKQWPNLDDAWVDNGSEHTAKHLESLPTLCVSQADDLKINTAEMRVWISRCSIEDGEPFNSKVTVEGFINDRWQTVGEFAG